MTGHAALEDADGLRVSTETARRMACDAGTVVMVEAADGSVLDVGRKTRTIPPALRRALQARDHGCRFPGCNARRTDAHYADVEIMPMSAQTPPPQGRLRRICRHNHSPSRKARSESVGR